MSAAGDLEGTREQSRRSALSQMLHLRVKGCAYLQQARILQRETMVLTAFSCMDRLAMRMTLTKFFGSNGQLEVEHQAGTWQVEAGHNVQRGLDGFAGGRPGGWGHSRRSFLATSHRI